MTREQILAELKGILAKVNGVNAEDIVCDEDTNLQTGLGLNSIAMLYMVISIESQFGIRFEGLKMEEMTTVGVVIDYIQKHK
ncbi:MAG: acyl carrier protein [Agathobacter sp.]|nr:acyl carrier protein [Agathobacter sp.]